ncbi:NFX1-type zinc finger-containing protein 1-like [Patiria miniata]|uniref:RZ-type domain-containing protein n=1 Tax=Patiria miniata TaxID=46514 RepID=A0A914B276_PATMI|nr:NFX1-type zinc finger-containing protein 1-like [Patiria miniata]
MDSKEQRQSVFKRLGKPTNAKDSRRIFETSGSPTYREYQTESVCDSSVPCHSGRSEKQLAMSSRKRHCTKTIEDDGQLGRGLTSSKRPRESHNSGHFGDHWGNRRLSDDRPGCSFWDERSRGKSDSRSPGLLQGTYDQRAENRKWESATRKPPRGSRQEEKSRDQIKEQTRRDLRQLTSLDTGTKIASWLACRPECLATIVGMEEMSEDDMEKLLRVLARACTEGTYFQSMLKIVLNAVADSQFFKKHLPEWIMRIRFSDKFETIVGDICSLCSSILQIFPKQAVHVALVLSLLYANYHSQMKQKECSSGDNMLDKIRELIDDCNVTLSEVQDMQKHKALNKFRKMCIIPDLDEIRIDVKPILNPNLKHGAYDSVDSYLDTQFRLLREDFVAPLRAGICSFIKQQQGESAQKRVDDVRVYRKVHIMQPVCGLDGVSYSVKFDISGWNPRRLASQKILRYGSLVCLSADEFMNICFAVVTNRDQLAKGIVDIHFQETVTDCDVYNTEYIMAESDAFFEAYRPVLKGLQQITQGTLPLKKYIIEASCLVSAPQFLQDAPQANYDLTSLFKPECAFQALRRSARMSNQQIISDQTPPPHSPTRSPTTSSSDESAPWRSSAYTQPSFGSVWTCYRFDQEKGRKNSEKRGISNLCETKILEDSSNPGQIPIRRFEAWPGESVTCLDESQRRAVYAALTQELAVIQGPPGTGKTYVGLKIMEVLLNKRNRDVWSGEKIKRPILVVCYTNHALDQFLEGILQFEGDVVRIGSRSKSQTLEKYNLKHVKQQKLQAIDDEERLDIIKDKLRLLRNRDACKRSIEDKVREASAFTKAVIGFKKLERVMTPRHIQSLCSRPITDSAIISHWLELESFLLNYSRSRLHLEQVRGHQDDVYQEDLDSEEERMLDDELDGTSTFTRIAKRGSVTEHTGGDFILEQFKIVVERGEDGPNKQDKLKALQYIERHMRSTDRLSQNEANEINDVWNLHIEDKWKLYRHWVDMYRTDCLNATSKPTQEYDILTPAIKEIENVEVCRILRDVKVIGMTTTGAAKWQSVLQQVGPRIVVVEEAAEVMEAHVITTLSQHCQHLILIGDHQQLKPNPAVYRLAKQYNLDISLFERLVNNNFPLQTLARQHRMRPEISEIMRNHFYKDLQDDDSVLGKEKVRGITKNMFFINHGFTEDSCDDGMKSHSSKHEADMIVALSKYLLQQGYSASQVTILTVYTGQLLSIKALLRDDPNLDGVRVSVVDNYQGEESDIVLLSLVRSNDEGVIGFLSTHNRICVMLSRAKLGLFCIGNFDQLAAKSDKWKAITGEMREKQLLGDSLVLACSVHPEVETKVACAADFKKVPDGGCTRPCEFRLTCGHVCTRSCHPDDRSHTRFVCRKPCERAFCEAKHKCPNLCGEECPRVCEHTVVKQLPGCDHSAKMKCFNNPAYFDCVEKCGKQLQCGHTCRNKCGQPCIDRRCVEKVLRSDLPCGHQEMMPCSDDADQCPALCGNILACGHKCPGKCSSCLGGRLHVSCKLKCGRILVCGHKCRFPCASNCPPCQAKCENRCIHSECKKKCWEPCTPCQEPCKWKCRHHKCGKKCSEPCDRPPCDKPCMKRLRPIKKCGHPCIGMCGEPCPTKCRVCDKKEVTEIFFGCEDEDGATFVQLRDCGHVIEVSGLDQWMKQTDHSPSEFADGNDADRPVDAEEPTSVSIQLKSCPKCKTPIRRSTRYGSIINKMLEDIERVKSQVIGESDQNNQRKREIKSMLSEVKESRPFNEKSVDTIAKPLRSESPSLYELNLLHNQTNFAIEVVKLDKRLAQKVMESLLYLQTATNTKQVARRLFNPARPFRGTEQELLDFPNELRRLNLCIDACEFTDVLQTSQSGIEELKSQMKKVNQLLLSGKPLTSDGELETTELLQKIGKSVGGLGVSEQTKVMIVKAMGLSKGHWYKCPNGHVYAIGECGGAMQSAKCPACQAEIGGASHQLASGNSVASEMDGAQYAAWSEQANLANYDL